MTRPKFEKDAECPKCLGMLLHKHYNTDYLTYRCLECKYGWETQCADAQAAGPESICGDCAHNDVCIGGDDASHPRAECKQFKPEHTCGECASFDNCTVARPRPGKDDEPCCLFVESRPAEPLPCPWCGSRPEVKEGDWWHCARCSNEECSVEPATYYFPTRAEAIAAWNRRTT